MSKKNQIQIIPPIAKTYLAIFSEAHELQRPLKKQGSTRGFFFERGVGLVGKGKYRIVDAFERVRSFHEHITFNLVFDDIKTNSENYYSCHY